jgi:hypothetical protein
MALHRFRASVISSWLRLWRRSALTVGFLAVLLPLSDLALRAQADTARIAGPVDDHATVTLRGSIPEQVLHSVDMGRVPDATRTSLVLVLKRTAEQDVGAA